MNLAETPAIPELEFAFRIIAKVDPGLPIQRRPGESLEIIPITGGSVSGRIEAEVMPGGADWCLYRGDSSLEVEARYWFQTTEGEIVDVVNLGRISPPDERHPDQLFMTTPQFRTISPRLQWLTQRVFVGRAESFGTHTTIDVFEVVS